MELLRPEKDGRRANDLPENDRRVSDRPESELPENDCPENDRCEPENPRDMPEPECMPPK